MIVPPDRDDVHDGWSRGGWLWRLRYMAAVCMYPDLAAWFTRWANAIEAKSEEPER